MDSSLDMLKLRRRISADIILSVEPKDNQVSESSLSRVYEYVQKYDCAIITAFRNKERNKGLKAALLMSRYGVTKVKGSYLENYMEENQIEVSEDSYFVVNINNDPGFEEMIVSLGKLYCQDSVAILKKGGDNNYLVGTNNADSPGFNKIDPIGKIKMGDEGMFMTKVGNRPFVMESFDKSQINTKRLIIKYGKPVLEMI
jgi:hypothetical protein